MVRDSIPQPTFPSTVYGWYGRGGSGITETGSVELLDYVAVVDCGTPINPNLARVQTEGGLVQGIGMALSEDVQVHRERKNPAITPSCSTRSLPERILGISG